MGSGLLNTVHFSYSFFTINVKPSLTDSLVKPIMVVTFSTNYIPSYFHGIYGVPSTSTHQALYMVQVWSSIYLLARVFDSLPTIPVAGDV
jgi:hypothetical protein